MNSGGGVRPSKLWHWFAVAFLAATFLAEPQATMALTWQVFRGAGAVGGELLTGEPEPDVLNLQPNPDSEPGPDVDLDGDASDEGANRFDTAPDPDGEVFRFDGDTIHSVLDHGVDGVLALHRQVEDVQESGGFTVNVGSES